MRYSNPLDYQLRLQKATPTINQESKRLTLISEHNIQDCEDNPASDLSTYWSNSRYKTG